jgi:hypothetical protein
VARLEELCAALGGKPVERLGGFTRRRFVALLDHRGRSRVHEADAGECAGEQERAEMGAHGIDSRNDDGTDAGWCELTVH